MREMERDGEHIWLRQSVTFTVDGQTRTLEIAIPLRPGAPTDEVEALLREAQAGMARLSQDLDAQVAAIANSTPLAAPEPLAPSTRALPAPSTSSASHAPESPAAAAVPAPVADDGAGEEPAPALPVHPSPSPTTAASAAPRRATVPPRSEPPAPASARPSGSGVRETPAPVPSTPAGPSLALPQFLQTAQAELDLNPRQIMDRLGVKTLSGLNYREALETLRRQALRDGSPIAPPPAPQVAPAPAQPSHYFEEELDEPDVTFSLAGEDSLGDESGPYVSAGPFGASDEDEEYDDLALDEEEDVPDFGPPPTPVPTPARPPAARTATPSRSSATPAPVAPANEAGATDDRARAVQILGQLRSATPGGTPSTQQRTAFRNIVLRELGAEKTQALAQGVYRIPPERLGPEQLDALISWGKRDTFAEDADLVLATLRADRERAANAAQQSTPPAPAAQANGSSPRPPARGRPAPRPVSES